MPNLGPPSGPSGQLDGDERRSAEQERDEYADQTVPDGGGAGLGDDADRLAAEDHDSVPDAGHTRASPGSEAQDHSRQGHRSAPDAHHQPHQCRCPRPAVPPGRDEDHHGDEHEDVHDVLLDEEGRGTRGARGDRPPRRGPRSGCVERDQHGRDPGQDERQAEQLGTDHGGAEERGGQEQRRRRSRHHHRPGRARGRRRQASDRTREEDRREDRHQPERAQRRRATPPVRHREQADEEWWSVHPVVAVERRARLPLRGEHQQTALVRAEASRQQRDATQRGHGREDGHPEPRPARAAGVAGGNRRRGRLLDQ